MIALRIQLGYTGSALADVLKAQGIYAEFSDPDFLVLMPSPYSTAAELNRVTAVLCALPCLVPVTEGPPPLTAPKRVLSPRDAMFAETVRLPLAECEGRICAELTVSCPPAVPVVMCGERIDAAVLRVLSYYGVQSATVIR